ncbi:MULTISPECIES: IclR family transcriptional regulator [Spongiibacter]|uniref:IclR family transcriptional regulator n=1 Tax=Spongiibacter TaxID=630749 RepID=UPI0003B2E662|nr:MULTISPECIES: IclR family transcriptional regulator [Spongiibacter]MAY40413.1 IclR family transcriptional regulator [Spongiibacter sp.]MBI58406.1 IclR family transcriptional regulator [Spongiibacter sp.]MBU72832.1 IclR family transcriptional regulator [Spongiibacter sp.]|tara:strand:+ start:701 stop:1477 length:777 start_codon:yes stop_codon:yes gene_type:complete
MANNGRPSGEDSPGGIQVIARAAAIMRALSEHSSGMSLGAIAKDIDLPRSTVQRIVNALKQEGLVESLSQNGGLRLGPEVSRLVFQAQCDIISQIRPHLEALHSTLGESVALCRLSGSQVIVADTITAERELRIVFPVGTMQIPIYSTASGKSLLLDMDDEEVERLLPEDMPKLTVHTRSRQALLKELKTLRQSGIATDYDEHTIGITGFGIPVETYQGRYCVAVVLPSARVPAIESDIREGLYRCKADIEAKLSTEL